MNTSNLWTQPDPYISKVYARVSPDTWRIPFSLIIVIPKIKIAKVREYEFSDVETRISELIAKADDSDDMTIVAGMKAIVPEFKSQHSKYQILDKN